MSWVHSDDAVEATIAALENGRPGEIYNIVDDCPVSLNTWAEYAADQLHVRPPLVIPLWVIRLFMPYVAAFSSTRLPVSNLKAKHELSWALRFPSYQEGLKASISRSTP